MKRLFNILCLSWQGCIYTGMCFGLVVLNVAAHAQLPGQSCTGLGCLIPPKPCNAGICFKNPQDEADFERQNNCKFGEQCGAQFIKNKDTTCCGKDVKTGADTPVDKQIKTEVKNFDWANYQKQCPNMRQSTGGPDSLWKQCVVGQKHGEKDEWPVKEVIKNSGARDYCIDGCSTPQLAVSLAFRLEIFLIADKDNPIGHPNSSFYNACKQHDICYQTCSSNSQLNCDAALRDNSIQSCSNIPENHQTTITTFGISKQVNTRRKCIDAANRMFNVLSDANLGEAAFNTRRQQYCQCC
jgi:hypothetical protein